MKSNIFNSSLIIGLLLIMAGVAGLHSIPAALLVGGVVVLVLTLLLARWAGVFPAHNARGRNAAE